MHPAALRALLLGAPLVLGLVTSGCGPKQPVAAGEYHALATEHMRLGAYTQAVETYRALLDEYPFSEQSEQAELHIGVAQYMNNLCPEATASFTDFQRRHPTSPSLPMVGYLLGQCAEQQMRPSDRDQSASQNAHAYYQAVIQQFPTSPYAVLARDRLARTRETLATHELDVGRYYERHGKLEAAAIRYLDLVNRFPETDVSGEALLRLAGIYERQENYDTAVLAYTAVTYHHPTHEAAREAEEALDRLTKEHPAPSGDPLVLLRSTTGRTRDIAVAQIPPRQLPQTQRRGTTPAGGGLGLPGGAGPFGRTGPYGAGGARY